LTINANLDVYTYRSSVESGFLGLQSQTGTYWQYNAFVSGTLAFPKGYTAEVYTLRYSASHSFQGSTGSFAAYVLALKKSLLEKRASVGFKLINPFTDKVNYQTSVINPSFSLSNTLSVPFRSFGLSFNYNFGNLKLSKPQTKNKVNNNDLKQGKSSPVQ
jgi:hypothetical protein